MEPAPSAANARVRQAAGSIPQLSSGNVLRVLEQAEIVAARLQKTRRASKARIEELDKAQRATP